MNEVGRARLRIFAPLLLVGLTAAHPAYSTNANGELERIAADPAWIPLHLLLLLGIALFDLSLWTWPVQGSTARRLRALGVGMNVVLYGAFLGVDGVGAGVVTALAPPAGTVHSVLAVVVARLFTSPAVILLGGLGAAGWVLAAVGISMGSSATENKTSADLGSALVLLAGALVLGWSHAPPFGPVGAGLATIAALWRAYGDRHPAGGVPVPR